MGLGGNGIRKIRPGATPSWRGVSFHTPTPLIGFLEFFPARVQFFTAKVVAVLLAERDKVCAAFDLFLQVSAVADCLPEVC